MAVWIQIVGLHKNRFFNKKQVIDILNEENLTWELKNLNEIDYFEFIFNNQTLQIYFDTLNCIQFSGTSDLFSGWYRFVDLQNLIVITEIKKVFSRIANKLGIQTLYYFSEWFFSLDEIRMGEETLERLISLIKKYPDLKRENLVGLESNEYYCQNTESHPSH